MSQRISLDIQEGKDVNETVKIILQQLIRLVDQLNALKLPIIKGPNDELPEGLDVGQPVIDWSSGMSQLKVWNGKTLV